ncbi:hypothetical protein OH784_09625 [Ectobacillus funiculus]
MGDWFEAVAILLAVLVPLGGVVWFLRDLIKSFGDASTITPLQDEETE